MRKFLTLFIVLSLVAAAAIGCGRKETAESEMTMPMSVSIEGMGTTNLITKAGTPVQAGQAKEITAAESAVEPAAAAGHAAPAVQEIQQALKNANMYQGTIDGKAGPATKKAITEFQQQNDLTADGKVGPKTWEKLRTYLNQ